MGYTYVASRSWGSEGLKVCDFVSFFLVRLCNSRMFAAGIRKVERLVRVAVIHLSRGDGGNMLVIGRTT